MAFCAPADVEYVPRSRRFAPAGPQPYPRSSSSPDWMEEWRRAPGGRWALIAALFAAPNGWPTLATDVADLHHSAVEAAGGPEGAAVLREYRVPADTAPVLRAPGNERFRGFGLSPEKAELVVQLGPATWLVLAANVEDSAHRPEMIRILRSARWVDR